MRLKVPKYYKNFKCIADKCKDSCCIGWEMPIDEMSVSLYKDAGGEFGERLRASLYECDGDVCFKQSEGGRCAFIVKSRYLEEGDIICTASADGIESGKCTIKVSK